MLKIKPSHFCGHSIKIWLYILHVWIFSWATILKVSYQYFSSSKAYDYPFYGTQWHPEKNSFEWTLHEAINHSEEAVAVTQYVADFFVNQGKCPTHTPDWHYSFPISMYNYFFLASPHPTFMQSWTTEWIIPFEFPLKGQIFSKKGVWDLPCVWDLGQQKSNWLSCVDSSPS